MSNDIRPYSAQDEPFGPTIIGDMVSNDVETFDALFSTNNWVSDKYRERPTIIVGRRGAGKTHYLRSVIFNHQYHYYVEIRTPKVLRYVAKIIQGISISEDIIFSEQIAEIWEMILWVAVFSEIRKHPLLPPDDLSLVEAYLSNIGVRQKDDIDSALYAAAQTVIEGMNLKHEITISEPIRNFDTFKDAKRIVESNLKSSNKKFVIIIDSIPDFQLDISSVESALKGLLMFVGSMNKPFDVVDIRFCLPSELYQRFEKLSVNPLKDFRRVLMLQWDEKDLVRIGAQRLVSYLAFNYREFYKNYASLDLNNYEDSLMLFNEVFPKYVINETSSTEKTVFYILRHTQFLPRHFLVLLNSIFKSIGDEKSNNPFPISGEQIVKGVQQMEASLVREIFSAFQHIYPTVEETCRRCLPELGITFSRKDLRRVFNDYGKLAFGSNSFSDFESMLLEIGVVGKVDSSTYHEVYIGGIFEHTPSRLLFLSEKDKICVHPLFSDIFQRRGKQKKSVYPYGQIDLIENESKKIFISYRRDDSTDIAGRIYDSLVEYLDKKAVFRDVDSIPVGLDFRIVVDEAVKKCDVFLLIIGKHWLELRDSNGNRRINDPNDFVRAEIKAALESNIHIIPILVQGAVMPPENELPEEIKKIVYINGVQIRRDPDFHKDMERLINKL